MRLSLVYLCLAALMLGIGMFLSNASVRANVGVGLAIVILCALSLVYFLQENKEPARPVMARGNAGAIAGLTQQMRMEPDAERYFRLRRQRDALAGADDRAAYEQEQARWMNSAEGEADELRGR